MKKKSMEMKKGALRWLCALLAAGILAAGLPAAALAEDPTPTPTAVVEPEAEPTPTAAPEETPTEVPTAAPEVTPTATEEPTATPEPTATATAAPTATPAPTATATAMPTVFDAPGDVVAATSETALTDEEIAVLTQGMVSTVDEVGGIMTLAGGNEDAIKDAIKVQLAKAQSAADGDKKYSDAFYHATGLNYDGTDLTGTLKWATPPAGCSVWNGTVPAADAYTVPTDGSVFQIDTADKLVWVMRRFNEKKYFKAELTTDIDLNGSEYYWTPGSMQTNNPELGNEQVLDGKNHTIYNLCSNPAFNPGFVYQVDGKSCIKNLTFDSGYLLNTKDRHTGIINEVRAEGDLDSTYSNLHVKNMVICSLDNDKNTGALFGRVQTKATKRTTLSNCTAQDCTVLGLDHVGSLTGCVLGTDAEYCYSTGCTVISYGAHSGGLFSCANGSNFNNCFTDVRLYGSSETGVFIGGLDGKALTFTNCAASGFVDGDNVIGGFVGGIQNQGDVTFTNCYTTALVGVNSDEGATGMGGFIGGIGVNAGTYAVDQNIKQVTFENCYAGGEVGNIHTALKENTDKYDDTEKKFANGGFVGSIHRSIETTPVTFTHSFYDKQTTAMREQGIGRFATQIGGDKQTFPTGVLTTTTTSTGKAATGLTAAPGSAGFTGFTDTDKWNTDLNEHYPELTAFKAATAGAGSWASDEMANSAKAFSLSSTSTVLLDTWDNGLNTATGEMDAATPGVNVYCTVRDLTSGFPLTSDGKNATENTNSNSWIQVANAYGETKMQAKTTIGGKEYNVLSLKHSNGTYLCDELVPGFEWLLVSNTVEGQTVTRHVRVTPTAAIEAGKSQMITENNPYNHREDVEMFFSTAEAMGAETKTIISGDYPGNPDSALYRDVALGKSMSVSSDKDDNATGSQLYVYLKEIEGFDADNKIKTGPLLEWETAEPDAQAVGGTYGTAFNGDNIFANNDKRYLVTYMWQLADGRVVQDAKIIRVAKVPFTVALNVFHNMNDTTLANYLTASKGTATDLVPAAYQDKLYSGGAGTLVDEKSAASSYSPNMVTPNAQAAKKEFDLYDPSAVAWKLVNQKDDYIKSVTLTMDVIKSVNVETQGSFSTTFRRDSDGNPLQEGSPLTMEYKQYRIVYKNDTYFTIPETVRRTYTLHVNSDGTYWIEFAKNSEPYHADPENPSSEIIATFKDMEFNLRADVVVGHRQNEFSLTKMVTGNLSDPDKMFTFTATCTPVDGTSPITELEYTLKNRDGTTENKAVTVTGGGTFALELKHGQTATFVNLPFESITVAETVDTGYVTSYKYTRGQLNNEGGKITPGTDAGPTTANTSGALGINRGSYVYDDETGQYVETPGYYVDLTFINNRENAVPTGIREDTAPFVVFGGLALAGLALLLALAYAEERRRKMNR